MKTVWVRKEVVAVHQTDPGYGNGFDTNPNLYLGTWKLSDFWFKKYERIGGYGDNGVFNNSDSDYLEYGVIRATFDLPTDEFATYRKETIGPFVNGRPTIAYQDVRYRVWHSDSVPDDFVIPAPPPGGSFHLVLANPSLSELAPIGTVVGTFVPDNAADAGKLTYVLDPGSHFSIQGDKLVVASALDYEGHAPADGPVVAVTVTSTHSQSGARSTLTPTIPLADVATTVAITGRSVSEGAEGAQNKLVFTFTRSGDVQGAQDISWTLSGVGNASANELDFVGQSIPGSGSIHFAAGATTKTLEFAVKGDSQPELDETFKLSTEFGTADATILNDDGPKTSANLINWAGRQAANLPLDQIPSTAHSLINAERNLNSGDPSLVEATRYWHGVEVTKEQGFVVGALLAVPVQQVYDAAKVLAQRLAKAGKPDLEYALRTDKSSPTSPPSGASEASFIDGVLEAGWYRNWTDHVTAPASSGTAPSGSASPSSGTASYRTASLAAASGIDASPPVIYVRSPDVHTNTLAYGGQQYTSVWGPTIPLNNSGVFVFDTVDDALLQTGNGNDQIVSARERANIWSGGGDDYITVRDSGSNIDAGPGNDLVFGGAGVDVVFGGTGNDVIDGGAGSDRLDGGAGTNSIAGGLGLDTVVVNAAFTAVTVTRIWGTTVVDTATSHDHLTGIERIQFADRVVSLQAHNDHNGDAFSDILLQNARTGDAYSWQLNGTNLVGAGSVGWTPGPEWQAKGTGDFNGDGGSGDILLQNAGTGECYIWEVDGTSLVGAGSVAWTPGRDWQARATGDFNGDGRSDILLQNTASGAAYIWELNGTTLIDAGAVGWATGPSWQAKATGDFNGDGRSDILLQNSASGDCFIWIMDGKSLIGAGSVGWTPGSAWQAKDTGDFNGDGKSDILLQNSATGDCYIWELDGTNLVGAGSVGWTPGRDWQAKGTGDYNGDGKSDIVLQNSGSGDCYIWGLNGTNLVGGGAVGWTPGPDWVVQS